MERRLRVFGSAPYLGQDQEVHLDVCFGDSIRITVSPTFDDPVVISVRAAITGNEGRYNVVTECLDSLRDAYENAQQEPPTTLLVMTWEKALNDAWGRVLP